MVFRSVAEPRFRTVLLVLMAVLVLLLTIVGVTGLTARAVALRRNEFGIRVALGARPGQIVAPVLGRVLAPVLAGPSSDCLPRHGRSGSHDLRVLQAESSVSIRSHRSWQCAGRSTISLETSAMRASRSGPVNNCTTSQAS